MNPGRTAGLTPNWGPGYLAAFEIAVSLQIMEYWIMFSFSIKHPYSNLRNCTCLLLIFDMPLFYYPRQFHKWPDVNTVYVKIQFNHFYSLHVLSFCC